MVSVPNSRMIPERDEMLSVARAAQELGVALGTIRRWADMGFVRCARTPGGQRRFLLSDLDAFRARMFEAGDSDRTE